MKKVLFCLLIFLVSTATGQTQALKLSTPLLLGDSVTKNAVSPNIFAKRMSKKRYRLYVAFKDIPADSVVFGPAKVDPKSCIGFGNEMTFSIANVGNGIELMRDPCSRGKNNLRLRRVWDIESDRKITTKKIHGKKIKDTTYTSVRVKKVYRSIEYPGSPRFFQVVKVRPVKIKKEGQPATYFKPQRFVGQVQYQVGARNPKKVNGSLEETKMRTAHFNLELPQKRKGKKRGSA